MLISVIRDHVSRYPSPKPLSTFWAFGSMLLGAFAVQFMSGLVLTLFFSAGTSGGAFDNIIYIVNDVNYGYIFKYLHLNGASFIFFFMYIHMFRSIYYHTFFSLPNVWYTGMLLFLLTIVTAFLGYVLPWGQMSF